MILVRAIITKRSASECCGARIPLCDGLASSTDAVFRSKLLANLLRLFPHDAASEVKLRAGQSKQCAPIGRSVRDGVGHVLRAQTMHAHAGCASMREGQ